MTEELKPQEEPIKFPLIFKECPHCGSTRRIIGSIGEEEKKKGKIGKDATPALARFQCIITDPKMVTLIAPVVMVLLDACADCGTIYCIQAISGTATPGAPPGKSLKEFGFPQNDPRTS